MRDMHKVIARCLVLPGSGLLGPVPHGTEPGFLEGRFLGGTLDELQLGCAAMAHVTQGAHANETSNGDLDIKSPSNINKVFLFFAMCSIFDHV